MRTPLKCLLVAAATAGLVACGDVSEPGADGRAIAEPSFARIPAACSARSLDGLARSYFSNPEQRTATSVLSDMETACAEGDDGAAIAGGWTLLSTIEAVLATGAGGTPEDGAALANGLIEYMCDRGVEPCASTPVAAEALGDAGIFAVRSGGAAAIVAHGAVAFTDFDGAANSALWGLETSTDWQSATGAPVILMYGSPTSASALPLEEISFGDLAYDLHSFPDVEGFADGELHVGVCYGSEVTLPHLGGSESNPTLGERLQREGTVLQPYTPGCGAWQGAPAQTVSFRTVLDGLLALADRAFLPQPLAAAFRSDRKIPSTGGTPIDFSGFAPIASIRSGSLQFVTPPSDGEAGQALPEIVVQALSGQGTPMELVEIQLYVAGNQGEPAGATFCDPTAAGGADCQDTAFTIEALDGYGTVAKFDAATLYKAGGYTICARALASAGLGVPGDADSQFTLAETCAPMVHIKN